MASDSTSLGHLLALFPEIHKELDRTFKDAVGRISRPGFQHSKEQVIIAEVFFSKKPDLAENDRREILALIKDAGTSRELKTRLRNWESSSTGGLSSFLPRSLVSGFTSLFLLKEWTSDGINEAGRKSREIQDFEFLGALHEKVSREPLLNQLARDVVAEAHGHLREFMRQRLPRLYSSVHDIKRRRMYHHIEAEANDQDQKRRESLRNDLFDEIKTTQARENSGYVSCSPQIYLTSLKCT